MKNMLNALYGNLKIKTKADRILVPLKVVYILFSTPFLLFAFGLWARSLGAIGSLENEKIGIFKMILLHVADVFWSIMFWGIGIHVIFGK